MFQIDQFNNQKGHDQEQYKKDNLLLERDITDLCSNIIKNGSEGNLEFYYADIRALSEVLLLSGDRLIEKQRQGADCLKCYVVRKFELYKNVLKESRECYDEIRPLYKKTTKKNIKVLVPLNKKSSKKYRKRLTDQKLRNIIRKSCLAVSRDKLGAIDGITIPSKKKHWNLLVIKEKNKLHILNWSGSIDISEKSRNFLGKGSFGVVQKVYDLSLAQFSALKIARFSDDKTKLSSRLILLNEVNKLGFIHEKNTRKGLQLPPYAIFRNSFYGYLQPCYSEGDLASYILKGPNKCCISSVEEGLILIREMMLGLRHLHSKRGEKNIVIHGDIKVNNIFVHMFPNRKARFYIGDFGGTIVPKLEVNIEDENSIVNFPFGTICTPGYFTFGDCKKLKAAIAERNLKKWTKYQVKRDLYAAAVTIWAALTGEMPYNMYMSMPYPNTKKSYGVQFLEKKYGNTVSTCLQKMLSGNPKKRPRAAVMYKIADKQLRELKKSGERGEILRVDE